MNKRLANLIGFGLLLLPMVLGPRISFAQGTKLTAASKLFYQGNLAYKEAKFEAAIENYEKALSLGIESGNLYYNLGNSYFKKGELGRAVLNYEKALLFIPSDSDLRSNREYVLSFLNINSQDYGNWFEKLADKIFADTTINFLTVFLSIIYIIVILALFRNLFFDSARKKVRILFLASVVLFALSAAALNNKITYLNKGAIVISKEADARFEPVIGATTYFKLDEGSKVEISEIADSWFKIKRPDGKTGWVDKKELGLMSNPSE